MLAVQRLRGYVDAARFGQSRVPPHVASGAHGDRTQVRICSIDHQDVLG
jgi:hypothetical protein